MKIVLAKRARRALAAAPASVQKAFYKQAMFLAANLQHPSLHAKKFDEDEDIWQARINRAWRFYFRIHDDTALVTSLIPHPK
jgi:mRNA-degrading endonuclease RelE of RelBE toxin-antitoxin system